MKNSTFSLFLLICSSLCLKLVSGLEETTLTACPQECDCLGSMVDCSRRDLTEIPRDLPRWVEILELQGNRISGVHFTAKLPVLQKIDLSNNPLSGRFDAGTIVECCPELRSLSLRKNGINEMPDIWGLLKLEILNLKHNRIRTVQFVNSTNLRELDLGRNQLDSMPGFPEGTALENLILDSNRIEVLSEDSLRNVANLRSLSLAKNRLKSLPKKESFSALKKLETLDFAKNRLKSIDGLQFSALNSLESLNLGENRLESLADGAFYGLNSLKSLILSDNQLTSVSKSWLYGLENLTELHLNENKITKIFGNSWEFCGRRLQILVLSGNKMEKIDQTTFHGLGELLELQLKSNEILAIANGSFNGLTKVRLLELAQNRLAPFIEDSRQPFAPMAHLEHLGLANNEIHSIPADSFNLPLTLRTLDLAGNPITSIDQKAFGPSLRTLFLNTTSLLCDCNLAWFGPWLQRTGLEDTIDEAKCAFPAALSGRNLLDLIDDPTVEFNCDSLSKPLIVEHPADAIALSGANVTFTCVANGARNQGLNLTWFRGSTIVDDESDEMIVEEISNESAEIDSIRVTSRLSVLNVTAEIANGDRFQCVAKNALGAAYSKRAMLEMQTVPIFTKSPTTIVEANSGSVARLECAAAGIPTPQISWRKDGGADFPAAKERRMHVLPQDDVFFITNVQASDAGQYACIAKNPAGTTMVNTTLVVRLPQPQLIPNRQNKTVNTGQTAVLECQVAGVQSPQIRWFHNGTSLNFAETNGRRLLTSEGQFLLISKTVPGDSGEYRCEITAGQRLLTQTAFLHVFGPDPTQSKSIDSRSIPDGKNFGGFLTLNKWDAGGITLLVFAVIVCVLGTSVVWWCFIYCMRKKTEKHELILTKNHQQLRRRLSNNQNESIRGRSNYHLRQCFDPQSTPSDSTAGRSFLFPPSGSGEEDLQAPPSASSNNSILTGAGIGIEDERMPLQQKQKFATFNHILRSADEFEKDDEGFSSLGNQTFPSNR